MKWFVAFEVVRAAGVGQVAPPPVVVEPKPLAAYVWECRPDPSKPLFQATICVRREK
jgi:hypothetical protein